MRSEGGVDYDCLIGPELPDREIIHSLVMISKEDAASLSTRVSSAHKKVLDARRQVVEMEETISKDHLPRGWKLQQVSLGPESQAVAASIHNIQHDACMEYYEVMKSEKDRLVTVHASTTD